MVEMMILMLKKSFIENPPKNVNLNITDILSNSVSAVMSPIEIEF